MSIDDSPARERATARLEREGSLRAALDSLHLGWNLEHIHEFLLGSESYRESGDQGAIAGMVATIAIVIAEQIRSESLAAIFTHDQIGTLLEALEEIEAQDLERTRPLTEMLLAASDSLPPRG